MKVHSDYDGFVAILPAMDDPLFKRKRFVHLNCADNPLVVPPEKKVEKKAPDEIIRSVPRTFTPCPRCGGVKRTTSTYESTCVHCDHVFSD